MLRSFQIYNQPVNQLSISNKLLINNINAHSYNLTQTDAAFEEALMNSDVLIPDGISVLWAVKWLSHGIETRHALSLRKIAGADLFFYEMERLQQMGGKCLF